MQHAWRADVQTCPEISLTLPKALSALHWEGSRSEKVGKACPIPAEGKESGGWDTLPRSRHRIQNSESFGCTVGITGCNINVRVLVCRTPDGEKLGRKKKENKNRNKNKKNKKKRSSFFLLAKLKMLRGLDGHALIFRYTLYEVVRFAFDNIMKINQRSLFVSRSWRNP